MTQEENIKIHKIARESHDDFHGRILPDDPSEAVEFKRGYISGYINAIMDTAEEFNLDLSLIIRKLEA